MFFVRIALLTSLLLVDLVLPRAAFADWTLNVGYQNPVISKYGINFLYLGQSWAFEFGIGYADAELQSDDYEDDSDNDKARARLAGDLDVKYQFLSGSFRPYLQGGFAYGVGIEAGDDNGAGANLGSGFVGLGILAGSKSLYLYLSLIAGHGDPYAQAGLGFDI